MKIDMSPEAVTTRLKRASQLRRLCLALGKAKPIDSGIVAVSGGKAPPALAPAKREN